MAIGHYLGLDTANRVSVSGKAGMGTVKRLMVVSKGSAGVMGTVVLVASSYKSRIAKTGWPGWILRRCAHQDDVGGYIDSSTRSEVEYVQKTGKTVRYLEEKESVS